MNGVIYARYSSDKQTEQSIEGQLRICKQYCKQNGIDVVDVYIDRALSASKNAEQRADFQRMIKDSDKQKWDVVVVYKLDRFARNRYDSATYKARLKRNGVRLISATENITDNPEGIILESVLEGMAEFYSKELSQKVTRGLHESALKANSTGGTIPIGYVVGADKKLHIDPLYAPLVKEAFQLYADGFTIKYIYTKFNEAGYRTKKGGKFNSNSFKTMFSNRKYVGVYTYNNEVEIEGGVPAIVDKELFDRVQMKLRKNAKAPARSKAIDDYILSGKLFCGHCGSTMVGESAKKSDRRYHYYACSRKKKYRTCDKKNHRKDSIERAVVEETVSKVLTEENIVRIADIAFKALEADKSNNTFIAALEAQKKEIERSISNLLKALEEGNISKAITDRIAELESQRADIVRSINQEQKEYPALERDHIYFFLREFLKGDVDDPEFQRHIIDMLVNSVYVYDEPDGTKLTIIYNISPEVRSEIHLAEVNAICSDLSNCDPPFRNKEPRRLARFLVF